MIEDELVAAARTVLARGDLLAAYDMVVKRRDSSHPGLNYLEVLILARLGDVEQGLRLYGEYRLDLAGDVDSLSLKARLLKDQAFATGGSPDRAKLAEACRLYATVYRQTRSSYPGINAATTAFMAGRSKLALLLARAVYRSVATSGQDDYYSLATLAEALVVLGELDRARLALIRAIAAPDADVGGRSTTTLQLKRLVEFSNDPVGVTQLLATIQAPRVAAFWGNIFVHTPELETRLAVRVRDVVTREQVGFAYGALAAGSDIVIAEQVLACGAELHVVLPFAEADFIAQSVEPGGDVWLQRYAACKAQASSVSFASNMSYVGEVAQFAYGSRVTMGMARLRARQLQSEAIQLVIVEEIAAGLLSRSDATAWEDSGGRSILLTTEAVSRPVMPPPPPVSDVDRGTHCLMFTDYPGFSALDERVLPIFWEQVMVRAAGVLESYSDSILQGNTWGDALYIVFKDARSAAAAALDLCQQFANVDCKALGVREGTSMRIALHYGSTYSGRDPVTGRTNYYGTEVSRAARIEPVTPAGSVYVTEPFAAVLEMDADHAFVCNYVGRIPLPKNYGVYPLYRLSRKTS